ncbi:MAG: hypothetical protein ACK4KV_06070 [Rhodocyclaceae bacterium]
MRQDDEAGERVIGNEGGDRQAATGMRRGSGERVDYAIRRYAPPGKSLFFLCAFTRRKQHYNKTFSLARYGTEAAALAAAIAWRDAQLAAVAPLTRAQFASKIRPNNKSGVAGVYKTRMTHRNPGSSKRYVCEVWIAVAPKGVVPRRSKSFSVRLYGDEEAFRLAVAAREAFLAAMPGYHLNNVPEAFRPAAAGETGAGRGQGDEACAGQADAGETQAGEMHAGEAQAGEEHAGNRG